MEDWRKRFGAGLKGWIDAHSMALITVFGAFFLLPVALLVGAALFAGLAGHTLAFDWGGFTGAVITVAAVWLLSRDENRKTQTRFEREMDDRRMERKMAAWLPAVEVCEKIRDQMNRGGQALTQALSYFEQAMTHFDARAENELPNPEAMALVRQACDTFSGIHHLRLRPAEIVALQQYEAELGRTAIALHARVEQARQDALPVQRLGDRYRNFRGWAGVDAHPKSVQYRDFLADAELCEAYTLTMTDTIPQMQRMAYDFACDLARISQLRVEDMYAAHRDPFVFHG